MLFERIVLRPNDFEISPPTKGVRENTIYAVRMQYFNDATTDDNGAYVKSYNTKRNYYIQYDTERQIVTSTKIFHNNIHGSFYYNERNGRQYNVVNVDTVDVFNVERYYRQNKSLVGLKRLIVKIKKPTKPVNISIIFNLYIQEMAVSRKMSRYCPMVNQNTLQHADTYAHQIKFLRWRINYFHQDTL